MIRKVSWGVFKIIADGSQVYFVPENGIYRAVVYVAGNVFVTTLPTADDTKDFDSSVKNAAKIDNLDDAIALAIAGKLPV